jgi:hypothetical protein
MNKQANEKSRRCDWFTVRQALLTASGASLIKKLAAPNLLLLTLAIKINPP